MRAKDPNGNVDSTAAEHNWTVDSRAPKVTFTEKPSRVTNDKTPTWTWTVEDANRASGAVDYCRLFEVMGDWRTIFSSSSCSSPLDFGAELPDGEYGFWIESRDQAGNYGYSNTAYFEVDNVALKVISNKPTGRRVSRYADVVVKFDDDLYGSSKFVNIYKKGSNTPLAVYRSAYQGEISISPKNALRRGTTYTVKVTTGVNDGANNLEAPKTWLFKTR